MMMFDVKHDFMEHRLVFTPVGSRVTCDPAPTDTDEDYLVCGNDSVGEYLKSIGFKAEGHPKFYTGNNNGNFQSYRRDEINIIVTPDADFYDLFKSATELAKRFNLLEKSDRIALFQAVLYGVQSHNLQT